MIANGSQTAKAVQEDRFNNELNDINSRLIRSADKPEAWLGFRKVFRLKKWETK